MKSIFSILLLLIASYSNAKAAEPKVSTSTPNGEVVVPYPGFNPGPDSLVVNGQAGSGQQETVTVQVCATDDLGRIIAFSCKETIEGKLNKPISIPDGLIIVNYSNSIGLFRKQPGQILNVKLGKVSVPRASEPVTFSVFRDITNSLEWQKVLPTLFGNPEVESIYSDICRRGDQANKEVCSKLNQAIEKKDAALFAQAAVKVNKKAEFLSWIPGRQDFEIDGRFWVVDPKDGEFVTVLPGVYGIEWINNAGDVSTTYGIAAE